MKSYFTSIFSREEVNTGRQPEMDWFKAVAVLLLILCHVDEVIFSYSWEDMAYCYPSFFSIFLRIVGLSSKAFGFMVAMGASTLFSRHNTPQDFLGRGKKLIIAWFILKVIYILPLSNRFARYSGMSYVSFIIRFLFSNDILCFAGLFFLYYGFLRKKGWSFGKITLLSAVIFAVGQFINLSFDGRLPVVEALLGSFVVTDITAFPFTRWLPAPILGIAWGYALRRCRNKDRFYLLLGMLSLVLLGGILLSLQQHGLLNPEGLVYLSDADLYYSATLATVFSATVLVMLDLSVYYALSRVLRWKWLRGFIGFVSRNMTVLYIAQWVLIPWLALLIPRPEQPVGFLLRAGIAACVFAIASVIALLLPKLLGRRKKAQPVR